MNDVKKERIEELAALDALERRELAASELGMLAPEYLAARASFDGVLGELPFAAKPQTPPPAIRERLLAEVRRESAEIDIRPGVHLVRSEKLPWAESPIPGLVVKLIHHDEARKVGVRLLRIAPGASYPSHKHGGAEEIFVLEGSVFVGGVRLGAGDYCRSEPGTEEHGTFSDEGGLAIVISSDLDEVSIS